MSFLTGTLSETQYGSTLANLARDSQPRAEYFVLVALACVIATFGLITNAPAVVIGSMLVAPLLLPVLGLSLSATWPCRPAHSNSFLSISAPLLSVRWSFSPGSVSVRTTSL